MHDVVINGKFFHAPLEGMPRVGRELISALDIIIGEPEYAGPRFHVLGPSGTKEKVSLRNISVEDVGRLKGLLWEQLELPCFIAGRTSLHLTGTAPIVCRNGCVVLHDAQFRSTPQSHGVKSRILYGVVTPIVARRFRALTSVSIHSRLELARYDVTSRADLVVIPNAADHVLRRASDDRILNRLQLRRHEFLLANSYSHDHKNVRILLEAALLNPGLAERIVLFGHGAQQDFAAKGIVVPEAVRFTGRVSDEELVSLMRNASAFLFPSITEGFGLPPLEAMQLGCPTICARAGALPEVCGDGALFIDPFDAAAWADAMAQALESRRFRERWAQSGLERANQFRWREAAQRYLRILQSLNAKRSLNR